MVDELDLSQLRVPEFGVLDLTEYPSLGQDFSFSPEFESGEYVVLNITRIGRRLSPIGYLRHHPNQSVLIDLNMERVVPLDYQQYDNLSAFISDVVSGNTVVYSSYVLVTGPGVMGLWFRRFPREFVSYISPSFISAAVGGGQMVYRHYKIDRVGTLSYFAEDGFGCYMVDSRHRICFRGYRVYGDGRVAEV